MEYVLPRFEVLLSTPVHHSITSGPMVGTVTAKYTYGMSVKGTLSVTVTANHRRKNSITKLFEINGESKFSFSSLELKELMMNRQRAHDSDSSVTGPLDINVSVKEALTGFEQKHFADGSIESHQLSFFKDISTSMGLFCQMVQ
ncbi:CD109 antigen [Pelobates cultripes]|uniref:CD109 antigen n=1 Tax=Pelobates cultripes TaxID=61616 RepID=A0AAD1RKL2_PELCU|nr:CD109 antigen [Pelobates cultripes]